MVKFASLCRQQFNALVSDMVTQLGPDTKDLMLRIGLHSGPVTAGVLRGQKSRFQLFGDTVNTASRMESNGVPNRIHTSQETAKLLIDAGKDRWVEPRDQLVQAKGKGTIQTYWAEPTKQFAADTARESNTETSLSHCNENGEYADQAALINWIVDIFSSLTKLVVAHRRSKGTAESMTVLEKKGPIRTVIDEFDEAIEMPSRNSEQSVALAASIELSEVVRAEIHEFVLATSHKYRGKSPSHLAKLI
jgi:Adenylate and Guanylate cyclase catalytic domain